MDNKLNEPAELMLRLFEGYDKRHIQMRGNMAADDKGKVNGKPQTVAGPLTLELIDRHIAGGQPVGVAPVRADSTCVWGVLDLDWYDMPEDNVLALRERLHTRCVAFRTKSRGLRVVVFVDEPIPAKQMHQYLVALRKRLPKSCFAKGRDVEVFPKETQTVVTPDTEPTAVWLPINGKSCELAWLMDDEGIKGAFDEISVLELLEHIDQHCRLSAEMIADIVNATPTLDTSDIGYKVPDNPAGRNDLLMRVAMSMQARGWPDTEMDAEVGRLNGDANFHGVFEEGPLPENEIVNLLKSAKRREKGTPTPLHYRQVEKFNRRWSKITISGTVEYIDKDAAEFTTFTKQMLFDETSDQVVRMGKSLMPTAQLWLRDPDHARFKGVVAEPVDYDGPAYNVWRGFAVAPKDGDASVFQSYIRDVLCSGDEGLTHWVTMWLADAVQRPTDPSPPTAIALRGRQGGGKSFLQERVLTPIFGERYVQKVQESERLFSRFNRSIFGATFIAAEESIFHGSQATAAKLKSFISSPSWTYEEKFKATVQAKNVHRLIASTNETQAVHIDFDDRRWTVVEVAQPFDMTTTDGQKAAYTFWEPYYAFMQSVDGPSIVLRYLLDYPVDRQALTYGYGTEAKARDKVASDPVIAVLHEIAERGVCPHDLKAACVISNKTLTQQVHQVGGRNMSPEEIANKFIDLIPNAKKSRKAMFCERVHTYTDMNGDASATPMMETRQRGHCLGTLDEFRDAVSRITMQNYGDGDEEIDFGGVDPAEFGVGSQNGWRAWEVAQTDKLNGDPPF
ncbi:hypothetical protein SAMN04487859_103241 [Roseovarius lutimaris]|uniref:Virulence-associated protein E n=1 Tax=Roseovarius lutimaris TaxID=1005928 RepID=A0A1I4ZI14_9RHOB|nr:DUF5906 domain-containing protein [Roseovarius lutimaris]SFN49904.1 hypothetical protein SAMN04487859_103241 [Roseovarius lutimaris]